MEPFHLALGFVASLAASVSIAAQTQLTRSSAAANFPLNTKAAITAIDATTPRKLLTLEVIGIGVSVEMYRQSQVWMEMQKQPKGSILPADLTTYPTNSTIKQLATDKRSADVLEWGASHFVEQWSIPTITVWASCSDPEVPSICLDSWDHVPMRSWPLFKARNALRTMQSTTPHRRHHDTSPA